MTVFADIKKHKKIIAFVYLLTFLNAIGEFILPRLMSEIVDYGIVKNDVSFILNMGMKMILVTILTVLVRGSAAYFSAKAAMRFSRDLRFRLFSKVNDMTFDDTETFGISSLITRTTNDVGNIEQLVLMAMRPLARAPLMILGGLYMSWTTNTRLTSIVILSLPFLVGLLYIILKRVVPYFPVLQEKLDMINLLFRQRLTGTQVIRAFSNDDYEEEKFDEASESYYKLSLKISKTLVTIRPVMRLFLNLAIIAIFYFGSRFVNTNEMNLGQLMAFVQYMTQMLTGFIMLSFMLSMLPRTAASIQRVEEVLEFPVHKTGGDVPLNGPIQTIEAKDLTFTYPLAAQPALCDLSFNINAGQTIGIIGGTGSGKSTLLKLLLNFYQPSKGQLLINNVPIQELRTKDLRHEISYVPQKNFFFTDTLRGNIHYSNPHATDERMIQELKTAQTETFIDFEDENVLDQEIVRGGANYSGGQRQRLAIARALSRDASLYIFDDSFSALDYRTDYNLRKELAHELEGKTTIIVAQRVATIRQADQIIVLNDGELSGVGTHEELLKTNQIYQEIAISQGEEDAE